MSYALLVIDMQKEYFTEDRPLCIPENSEILANVEELIQASRENDIEVVHVRHISADPEDATFRAGSEMVETVDEIEVKEDEPVITKTNPGAFYNTNLDRVLQKKGVEKVIICGLLSFICTDTTAREADARGYDPVYVEDATASIDLEDVSREDIDRVISSVQDFIFSDVLTTEKAVREIERG